MAEVEDLTVDGGSEDVSDTGRVPLEIQLEEVEGELAEVKSQIECLMHQQDELRAKRDQLLRQIEQERRAPRADWQQENFPWSSKLKQTMHDVFGLHDFRPLQREVMNAALQGRDVLCLLPSGGGKSLCYQLPALVSPGLTLVVSPLLSLIQDQVLSLKALGIKGACLTSLSSKEEVADVYAKMDRGELKLLYVTPEKIVSSKRFMSKLEKVHQAGRLDRIAIDEAHCASQWGNDFRPDYKKLGILKQQFPQVPIMALTATATRQVCEDLKSILRISGCEFFRASVNRPNLFYEVRPKPAAAADATAAIVAWIREHYPRGESGIVYCLTRKDCEAVAAELESGGLTARHYHADMDPGPREAAHAAWSEGSVQVICATVAFGMGINKPDVRFVIHHSLSKSVENYYQESGRAGRDGLPAHCLMYYRFSDALRQAAIVCFEPTWQPNLAAMMAYASGGEAGTGVGGCRRAIIQRHFAEAPADCRCMCDNCCASSGAPSSPPRDISRHALAVLGILRQQQAKEKKATLIQLVDLWRACKDAAISKEAKAMSKDENEAVIAAMMYAGLLQFEFGHTAYATNAYLKASARGTQLLEASESGAPKQLKLLMPAQPAASPSKPGSGAAAASKKGGKASSLAAAAQPPVNGAYSSGGGGDGVHGDGDGGSEADPAVRASLEQWRAHRARVLQVFPHSVLPAEQMAALCALARPVTEEALRQALGVRRYELYGSEISDVLAGRFQPEPVDPAEPGGSRHGQRPASGGGGGGVAAAVVTQKERSKQEKKEQVAKQERRQAAPEEVVMLDDSEAEGEKDEAGGAKAARAGKQEAELKKKERARMRGEGSRSGSAGKAGGRPPQGLEAEHDGAGEDEDDDGDGDFEDDVPLTKRRRP